MATPKFKIKLGSQDHLMLSGKRYGDTYQPDIYNCRLSLRCGPLQAAGTGDYAAADLCSFINTVVEIVASLRGECTLAPAKVGTFSIRVRVGNTGEIVTDVKVTTLTSDALDATGWNTQARFQTRWENFYHAIEVECLNVSQLTGMPGHTPSIEVRTKR